MELSAAKKDFAAQGLNVVGISYDSQEILKTFSDTRNIRIPLLSDSTSDIIRRFRVLMPGSQPVAYPGYYVVGRDGVITHALFFEDEDAVGARSTPLGLLARMFPTTPGRAARSVTAKYMKIELSQSDEEARWRNRLVLQVRMELAPGYHAYAPEVTGGYIPLALTIPETAQYWSMPPVRYPKARILSLPKLGEKLPIYEGAFQVTAEAAIKFPEFERVKKEQHTHTVEIQGTLRYQICNDDTCFPPEKMPVHWTVTVMPYDDESVATAKPVRRDRARRGRHDSLTGMEARADNGRQIPLGGASWPIVY